MVLFILPTSPLPHVPHFPTSRKKSKAQGFRENIPLPPSANYQFPVVMPESF
ncbi:MAG: hypothetical protein O9332_18925 [Microcystis sp. LE19-10.1B]|uniref:hypothetical protein n=1 Tax=Microcystis sp. LE19-10.1B TaxID=3016428 RepID=UPI0022C8C735|nr:hypothetical protein [Microcystis sp. LE19-10.1B]MCZ8027412.1 hypothetical protein [Microcystis sp. LE19-10.1B]